MLLLFILTASDTTHIQTSGMFTYEYDAQKSSILITNGFKDIEARIDIFGSKGTNTIEKRLLFGDNLFEIDVISLGNINSLDITPIS